MIFWSRKRFGSLQSERIRNSQHWIVSGLPTTYRVYATKLSRKIYLAEGERNTDCPLLSSFENICLELHTHSYFLWLTSVWHFLRLAALHLQYRLHTKRNFIAPYIFRLLLFLLNDSKDLLCCWSLVCMGDKSKFQQSSMSYTFCYGFKEAFLHCMIWCKQSLRICYWKTYSSNEQICWSYLDINNAIIDDQYICFDWTRVFSGRYINNKRRY